MCNGKVEFIVNMTNEETVAAALPMQKHWLPLSNLDLILPPVDVSVFFCYNKPIITIGTHHNIVECLKNSLAETLVSYYAFAGEVVKNSMGEPELLCNNCGVDFVEAFADVELQSLNLYNPDETVEGKLVPKKKHGVLAVQATWMKCGGLVVACTFDHRIADAYSATMFLAGCGGVIRGNQGEWLGGFAKHIGSCSAFVAELWGVVEGLCLAQRLAFSKIELCIDSQAVVQVIESGRTRGTTEYALLKKIRGLLALEWEVKVSHVYRESNRCADPLANIGRSLNHNIIFYVDCPDEIKDIMSADVLGITTPRMIVV